MITPNVATFISEIDFDIETPEAVRFSGLLC